MKFRIARALNILVAIGLISTCVTPISKVFAASNVLYIYPNQSQMSVGTTFCVDVISYATSSADPGTSTGALTFSSNVLQVVGISANGKKCPDAQGDTAPSYYSNRSVTAHTSTIDFDTSQSQADGGIRYVFAVTFKAKAGGTATIDFSGGSQVNNSQTTLKGGPFSVTAPQPTPTPTPTPKTNTSSGSKTTTPAPVITTPTTEHIKTPTNTTKTPETTTDPTGLIDSVIATPLYTSSTVTWRVNAKNTSASFRYGTSYDQLDKQAGVKKSPDGNYSVSLSRLFPGTYYYFTITANGKNISAGNYSSSFVTNGYPVILTITENNVPVQSAQVKIGEQSLAVDNGTLSVGLAAGNYSGVIRTDTATLNINLTVKDMPIPGDGSAPVSQPFAFNLTSSTLEGGPGSSSTILAFVGILAGGTILLAFGFVLFMNYRRNKFESDTYSTTTSKSTVVVEDGYNWQQKTEPPETNFPQPSSLNTAVHEPPLQHHKNSVYLTEEEPLDMFEKADLDKAPSATSIHQQSDETQQNPSSPHSTTP